MSSSKATEARVPFTLSTPEFDENTYWGRFEEFRKTANPLHAFYPKSRILAMQDLLNQ